MKETNDALNIIGDKAGEAWATLVENVVMAPHRIDPPHKEIRTSAWAWAKLVDAWCHVKGIDPTHE